MPPETAEQRHARKMAEVRALLEEVDANHERWVAQHQGRPSTFDTYSAFHQQELSEDEREIMADAELQEKHFEENPVSEDRRWRKGFIDGDYRLALYPKLAASMRIALDRATAQTDRLPFPEEPGLIDKYPGVDPRGKNTEFEMALADRLARVRAALAVRPPEIREYVDGVLSDLSNSKTELGKSMTTVGERGFELRILSRAAKVALDRDTSEHLQEEFDTKLPTIGAYKWADQAVQALESLAGLRDDPITDEMRQALEQGEQPIPDGLEALRDAPNVQPEHIEVDFPNFDNIMAYQYLSHPANWGKSVAQVPADAARVEPVAAAVTRYANANAARSLDPMFRQAEANGMNRGGLIIVDGMTVEERMQAEYAKLGRNPAGYDRWYAENVRQMSAEMVSAALMAGKRVEAFIPDQRGRIPAEPVQLTKTGYEPSPLKKVTLNAWERHFARLGFYKEKAAQAVEYQRTMEARERARSVQAVRQCATDSYAAITASFFGDPKFYERAGMPNAPGFPLTRTAPQTACICMMAAEGKYSIADLFDPTKLQAEKLAAGRLYLEKAAAGDNEWLGRVFQDGMGPVSEYAMARLRTVNLSDRSQLAARLPEITRLGTFCMDVAQEAERGENKAAVYRRAMETAGAEHANEAVELGFAKASWVAQASFALKNAFQAHNDLISPRAAIMDGTELSMAMGRVAATPQLIESIRKTLSDPHAVFVPEAPSGFDMLGVQDRNIQSIAGQMRVNGKPDPARLRALSSLVRSGELSAHIVPEVTPVTKSRTIKEPQVVMGENGPEVRTVQKDVPSTYYKGTSTVSKSFADAMKKHMGLTDKAQRLEARVDRNQREAQAKQEQREAQAKQQQAKQPKPAQPKPMGGGRAR